MCCDKRRKLPHSTGTAPEAERGWQTAPTGPPFCVHHLLSAAGRLLQPREAGFGALCQEDTPSSILPGGHPGPGRFPDLGNLLAEIRIQREKFQMLGKKNKKEEEEPWLSPSQALPPSSPSFRGLLTASPAAATPEHPSRQEKFYRKSCVGFLRLKNKINQCSALTSTQRARKQSEAAAP